MKILTFALIFVLSCNANAEWIMGGCGDNSRILYNDREMVKKGYVVGAWTKRIVDYNNACDNEGGTDGGTQYVIFDCKNKTMGGERVVPDTIGETTLVKVCLNANIVNDSSPEVDDSSSADEGNDISSIVSSYADEQPHNIVCKNEYFKNNPIRQYHIQYKAEPDTTYIASGKNGDERGYKWFGKVLSVDKKNINVKITKIGYVPPN